MYEQYFGLRGRPFATAPDPDFYFESRGHHRALAYLRHGIREGDSFMVMTGEVGAGKTTLVHKLMRELDSRDIVAALLVSSQLDARELLAATLGVFGEECAAAPTDELQARLGVTVAALAAQGRRALLVIDEAQNLRPDAVALLTEFAARQAEGTLALQVLLVGQPELRRHIQDDRDASQRQPVFLFCHVGMLGEHETGDYIVHRLRHVGWTDAPGLADAAFHRIHERTDGVPRRINRLCDRLLLACYLRAQKAISARLVDQVDAELRVELGEGSLARATPQAELAAGPALATPPHRAGPRAGRAIPTLTSWVPPPDEPSVAPPVVPAPPAPAAHAASAQPAAVPSPVDPPAAAWTDDAWTDADVPSPRRRAKHRTALVATGAVLALAVLIGSWIGRSEPPTTAGPEPPSPSAAPVRAPPAVLPPTPSTADASCTAAVTALGLCPAPATTPKE